RQRYCLVQVVFNSSTNHHIHLGNSVTTSTAAPDCNACCVDGGTCTNFCGLRGCTIIATSASCSGDDDRDRHPRDDRNCNNDNRRTCYCNASFR
ncbi:unnamed protein product, partial [Rotaria sp. Silwood2]